MASLSSSRKVKNTIFVILFIIGLLTLKSCAGDTKKTLKIISPKNISQVSTTQTKTP